MKIKFKRKLGPTIHHIHSSYACNMRTDQTLLDSRQTAMMCQFLRNPPPLASKRTVASFKTHRTESNN